MGIDWVQKRDFCNKGKKIDFLKRIKQERTSLQVSSDWENKRKNTNDARNLQIGTKTHFKHTTKVKKILASVSPEGRVNRVQKENGDL